MVTNAQFRPPKFSRILKQFQENDNDVIIAVSGARGIGKSVLVAKICEQLLGKEYLTKEGFTQHNIYNRGELVKKMEDLPNESVLNVDEAITTLFKREFQNRNQNKIIKMLNMYRDKRHIIFLLVPNFWDLDASVRNSLIIKFWIHVTERGFGYIFTHQDNPFQVDPFMQKYNVKVWQSKKIWTSPNYFGSIGFSNLDDNTYDIYKKVKAHKRRHFDREEKGENKLSKKVLARALHQIDDTYKVSFIASTIKATQSYVHRALKN